MPEKNRFLDELRAGVLIGDGAIGTELFARGAPRHAGVERLNVSAPDMVETLHRDYIAAGSRVIETNTFAANRIHLDKYNAGQEVRDIILAGVGLARKAAGNDVYTAGSIGPLPPVDGEPVSDSERDDIFSEVILALLDGGVDLLMFETFVDLSQLSAAIRIARSLTDKPVVAQMAFEADRALPGGENIERFVGMCTDAGADVLGANCGEGIHAVRDAVIGLSRHRVLMSAYPNAGFAEKVEERKLYVASPGYLAEKAVELVSVGVRLVGGCCGTGPDTIRAMVKALSERESLQPVKVFVSPPSPPEPSAAERVTEEPEQPIPKAPRGVLVELDPPKHLDIDTLVTAARRLKNAGVAAVTLADNPLASVRVDVLAVAGILKREIGVDVIPHLTGRDRNRIALQSTIMGAYVLGIQSLLCVTGDPVRMYHETNTSGVFDVTSVGLVKLVSEFNSGQRLRGKGHTALSIGVALNPNVRSIEGQVNKLMRKIDAGAHFALTQPIFSIERLDVLQEALEKAHIDLPVYIGIMPLISARNADFLHHEVPGIVIPEEFRKRLKRYENIEDQRAQGSEIAVELVEQIAPRAHGIYIITPRNNANFVLPVIRAAGNGLT